MSTRTVVLWHNVHMTDRARTTRSETLRVRVKPTTKAEVEALARQEKRTESDIVRILLEEALAARAARR
jgi:hypothetical protein